MARWSYIVTVGALALSIGSPAWAQAQAQEIQTDPHYPEAKQRMHEGKLLYEQGKFELARMKYAEACALMRTFSCLRSLGATEYRTGHFVEAYQHLSEIFRDPKVEQLPQDVRQKLEIMKQAAYDATGRIEVSAPVGSTVWLDGSAAGTAPLADPLVVAPGKHTLEVRGPDGGQHADVDAVAAKSIVVDLRPVAPPPPPAPAASAAARPPPETPAAPLAGSGSSEKPVPRASFWTPPRIWGGAIAGAGVVSLLVGGAFVVQTQQDANSVASLSASLGPTGCSTGQTSNCAALQNAHSDQSRDFTLTAVFLGVGSAAVLGGAALFFWPQHQSDAATLLPMISPQGAGIQLRGEL